jgi:hypothetical protein
MKFDSIEQGANIQYGLKALNTMLNEINDTPEIWADQLTRQELNTQLLRLYCNLMNTADVIKETRIHINK